MEKKLTRAALRALIVETMSEAYDTPVRKHVTVHPSVDVAENAMLDACEDYLVTFLDNSVYGATTRTGAIEPDERAAVKQAVQSLLTSVRSFCAAFKQGY